MKAVIKWLGAWFVKLPAIAQLTILIISTAFFIAIIDVTTRIPFMELGKRGLEVIWQNGQWLLQQ